MSMKDGSTQASSVADLFDQTQFEKLDEGILEYRLTQPHFPGNFPHGLLPVDRHE